MTFQDKVIAKIKEYFPDVEFIKIGDGNTGEGFAWAHAAIMHESAQGSAEDMVINALCDRIKYLKEPDIAFIRLADSGSKMDSNTGNMINSAMARFSLGYKI